MLRRPRDAATWQPSQERAPNVRGAEHRRGRTRGPPRRGETVALTRIEFDVLEALSARPKLFFSRCQFIDQTWVGDDPGSPRHVLTVRGLGYLGEGI